MGTILSAVRAIAKNPISTVFLGGGGRRIMTGAIIGGAVGAARSENESSTGKFKDIMTGALAGAGVGSLTTGTAMRAAVAGAKSFPYLKAGKMAGVGALKTAGFGITSALGVVDFAVRRPLAAMAIGAAGVGLYANARGGPGSTYPTTEAARAYAVQQGRSSTDYTYDPNRRRTRDLSLEQSTTGLVQGLHASRHR